MKEDTGSVLDNLGIEYTFTPSLMLRILLDKGRRRSSYWRLYSKDIEDVSEMFVRGYSFAIVSLLDWTLYHLMIAPEYIGMRKDDRTVMTYKKSSTIKGFIDSLQWNSSMNSLARNIQYLRKNVLRAASWERLDAAVRSLSNFAEVMLKIFNSSYMGYAEKADGKRTNLDKSDILSLRATNSLLVFFNDKRRLDNSFSFMLRTKRSELDPKFLSGYSFANVMLWEAFLPEDFHKHINIFRGMLGTKTWDEFDDYFDKLNKEISAPFEKRVDFSTLRLVKSGNIQAALRRQLIVPTKSAAKLSDPSVIFTHPVKVVSDYISMKSASFFKTVLAGLVHVSYDLHREKAWVIELKEPGVEIGNVFTFALLMPAYGIWDASEWWVFHDFCTDDSGTGSRALSEVLNALKKVRQKIRFETFNVDENILSAFLERDDIKYLRDKLKDLSNLTKNMKGSMLELLMGHYFYSAGFDYVKLHVKPPMLMGFELDVVAAKRVITGTQLVIVECKGASAILPEENEYLRRENNEKNSFEPLEDMVELGIEGHVDKTKDYLDRFRRKLKAIRGNPSEFLQALDLDSSEAVTIEGVYVSTSELPRGSKWVCSEFSLWDLGTLRAKFKEAHITKDFLTLIERCNSSQYICLNDLFFDDFFDN